MSEIDDELIVNAFNRIALTADGAVLYAYLQKVAIGILPGPDVSDGALRSEHGRRSLAHQMMGLMAKGIDESGGRTDSSGTGGKRTERAVVFLTRQPSTGGVRVTARDHIARTDPELAGGGT